MKSSLSPKGSTGSSSGPAGPALLGRLWGGKAFSRARPRPAAAQPAPQNAGPLRFRGGPSGGCAAMARGAAGRPGGPDGRTGTGAGAATGPGPATPARAAPATNQRRAGLPSGQRDSRPYLRRPPRAKPSACAQRLAADVPAAGLADWPGGAAHAGGAVGSGGKALPRRRCARRAGDVMPSAGDVRAGRGERSAR